MFEYLKKYVFDRTAELRGPCNAFFSVAEKAIEDAEERLGYAFPSQLKTFYRKVGCGSLKVPCYSQKGYDFFGSNTIHDPDTLADIVLLGHDSGYISESTWEFLQPGYLPFFEIGDSTRFLTMKAFSDNPNAVWNTSGRVKIEDSFERFIWRLYYEDPAYYDTIIEDFYKTHEV